MNENSIVIDTSLNTKPLINSLSEFTSTAESMFSKTMQNAFAPLNDIVVVALSEALIKVNDALEKVMQTIQPLIDTVAPILEQSLNFLVDNMDILLPAIVGVVVAMKTFQTAMAIKSIIEGAINALQVFKKANDATTISQAALNFVMNLNPFILIATLVAGVVAALIVLWNTNEGFREAVVGAWTMIKDACTAVWSVIVSFFTETIPAAFQSFMEFLSPFIEFWSGIWTQVSQFFLDCWNSIVTFATETVPAFIATVVTFISELPGKIWEWLVNIITSIGTWIADMVAKAQEVIPGFIETVVTYISELPGRIWEWLVNIVASISTWISDMVAKAQEVIPGFIQSIVNFFVELPGKIWSFLVDVVTKIGSWAGNLISKAQEAFPGVISSITRFFTELPGKIMDVGKNIVSGLWNGISGSITWLYDKISSWCSGIMENVLNFFGIHSPSTVFRDEVGAMISEGIAVGITENEKSATDAFKQLLANLDTQRKFGIISEEEYYSQLEKLRDQYLTKGSDEWMKYTGSIYDYHQKQSENIKKEVASTYNSMLKEAEDNIDKVKGLTDKMSTKLQNHAAMTETITFSIDGKKTSYDKLASWQDDIKLMSQYGEELTAIKNRDASIPKEFFSIIADMSIDEGLAFAKLLNSASKEEFDKYIQGWKDNQRISKQVSSIIYADDMADALEKKDTVPEKVKERMSSEYGEIGLSAAESFAESFVDELNGKEVSGSGEVDFGVVNTNEQSGTSFIERMKVIFEAAGKTIPEGFFLIGASSAEQFGNGFQECLQQVFADAQAKISTFNSKMVAAVTANAQYASDRANSIVNNTNYTTHNYNVTTNGSSPKATADAIKNQQTLTRMLFA